MNKVILMGRLTRDPEVSYSQNGNNTCVCRFSLAVDRRFKREGQPEADFFNCTVFGKRAEAAEKYLKKSTKVVVEGSIQNNNYTNKNGEKVYDVRVVIDDWEFAESKNAQSSGDNFGGNFGDFNSAPGAAGDGFMNIPEGMQEELPFN